MPGNYHTDGPETERLAYHSRISPRKSELQRKVYDTIRNAYPIPLCADEVIGLTRLLDYTCRPRITELSQMGAIRKLRTKANKRGNPELAYVPANPLDRYDDVIERHLNDTGRQSQDTGEQGFSYA